MTVPSAEDVAARLKAGAWQFELHMSMSRQHLLQSRSVVDPRVQLTRVTPKRGDGQVRDTFHFEDNAVDVETGGHGAILLGAHEFATLEALAAAIARHDREIDVARAWAAAEPARTLSNDRRPAMQTAVTAVALAHLRIDEVANVRKTGRGSEPPFVASIRAKGIIEPLTVRPNGAGYKVVNGGKRLAALEWMAEHRESIAGVPVDGDYPVLVTVRDEDDRAARETSLITNIVRAGMHPVDEFEAFVALVDDGMTVADVAARYALDEKQVRQRLALGRLAPPIREAWRAGAIDTDVAKSFTLGGDHAEQVSVFDRLAKSGGLGYPHQVTAAFYRGGFDLKKQVKFLGPERIAAAGVAIRPDLFGEHHIVDPEAVAALTAKALEEACETLRAEGWSWVALEADLPEGARWSWSTLPEKKARPKPTRAEAKRIAELESVGEEDEHYDDARDELERLEEKIAARAYTDDDKGKAGCIVSLGHDGALEVKRGLIRPTAARAKKPEAASGEVDGARISDALAHDLSVSLTMAVRETMAAHPIGADAPHTTLAALLAAFLCQPGSFLPLRVRSEGFGHVQYRTDGEAYAAVFERLLAMSFFELFEVAAGVASTTVHLERHRADQPPMADRDVAAVVSAIDGDRLQVTLRAHFDPEDYFKRASAAVALAAIAEMGLEKGKASRKPDLAAIAVAGARETGWLPAQLRTERYAGPGEPWRPSALAAATGAAAPVDDEDEDFGDEERDAA